MGELVRRLQLRGREEDGEFAELGRQGEICVERRCLGRGRWGSVGGVGVAYGEVRSGECGPLLVRPRGMGEQFEDVEGVGCACVVGETGHGGDCCGMGVRMAEFGMLK
jgi:hypothetical protein